jgi:hypothetical protein
MKSFTKAEKINFTSKPDPAPRIIQPRDPRYNVEVGRRIAHIEKPLFKALAKMCGHEVVFKGMTADK